MAVDDQYTKSLLHFDNNFTDESGKTWTAYGGAGTSTAQSKFGGSALYLNGSQYIETADSDDWFFGVDNFTIDCILIPTDTSASKAIVSQRYAAPVNHCFTWYIESDGGFSFEYSGTLITAVGNNNYTVGNTYHVAIVRNGNTIMFFLNGIQVDSTQAFTASLANFALPLQIGTGIQSGVPSNNYSGYIDEFRISKGIARWTSNFTPPTAPYGTPLRLCQAIGGF